MARPVLRLPFVVAGVCFAAAGLSAAAGAATLVCFPRKDVFARLESELGERPSFAGVTTAGALFEVLVGPDGSFTAFLSFPDGLTCPVAAGEGWRAAPLPQPDPEA
ncbi:MAG: hypothetical protein ACFCUW_06250 [Kiloniellaceae bacterium]